jgi:hypothetical protein
MRRDLEGPAETGVGVQGRPEGDVVIFEGLIDLSGGVGLDGQV